jgi:hypothetical protein
VVSQQPSVVRSACRCCGRRVAALRGGETPLPERAAVRGTVCVGAAASACSIGPVVELNQTWLSYQVTGSGDLACSRRGPDAA